MRKLILSGGVEEFIGLCLPALYSLWFDIGFREKLVLHILAENKNKQSHINTYLLCQDYHRFSIFCK